MNMNDTVRIVCENTGRSLFVNRGTSPVADCRDSVARRAGGPSVSGRLCQQPAQGARLRRLLAGEHPLRRHHAFRGNARLSAHVVLRTAKGRLRPVSGAETAISSIRSPRDSTARSRVWRTSPDERDRPDQGAHAATIVAQDIADRAAEGHLRPRPRRCTRQLGLDDKIALLRDPAAPVRAPCTAWPIMVGYFYGATAPFRPDTSTCFDLHPILQRVPHGSCRSEPLRRSSKELVPQEQDVRGVQASTRAGST